MLCGAFVCLVRDFVVLEHVVCGCVNSWPDGDGEGEFYIVRLSGLPWVVTPDDVAEFIGAKADDVYIPYNSKCVAALSDDCASDA